jgi:hypothetical protein
LRYATFLLAPLLTLCAACTSVSSIVSNPRPALPDWESVRVLLEEPPQPYETVGVIDCNKLQSMRGSKADTNTAINAMKKEAAKMGANAIIITNRGEMAGSTGTMVPAGGTMVFARGASHTLLASKAIYLQP